MKINPVVAIGALVTLTAMALETLTPPPPPSVPSTTWVLEIAQREALLSLDLPPEARAATMEYDATARRIEAEILGPDYDAFVARATFRSFLSRSRK